MPLFKNVLRNKTARYIVLFAVLYFMPSELQLLAIIIIAGRYWLAHQKSTQQPTSHRTSTQRPPGDDQRQQCHSGVIVDLGEAPYKHDKANARSFYISLRTATGEVSTLWSIDLQRVAHEQKLTKGHQVELAFLGKQPVVVKRPVHNEHGVITSYRQIATHRNTWQATVLAA
ncbi:hypothetical protein [Carnimonas bestiolae]|uniref:hypothetical protein n=1 Tax=Carnimonas bestiolae TaxID=3402172 RepID=UPI003EDC3B69